MHPAPSLSPTLPHTSPHLYSHVVRIGASPITLRKLLLPAPSPLLPALSHNVHTITHMWSDTEPSPITPRKLLLHAPIPLLPTTTRLMLLSLAYWMMASPTSELAAGEGRAQKGGKGSGC